MFFCVDGFLGVTLLYGSGVSAKCLAYAEENGLRYRYQGLDGCLYYSKDKLEPGLIRARDISFACDTGLEIRAFREVME